MARALMRNPVLWGAVVSAVVLLCSCGGEGRKEVLLRRLGEAETGIAFNNEIATSDSINYLSFYYTYNGGGIGVSDFDGDGRLDLFFGGNMVSSRLYLNRGNLTFDDVTEEAGVLDEQWVTGVSVVDVNRDGRPDLYLSTVNRTNDATNRLYVNQGTGPNGVPTFEERAEAYRLDVRRNTTQAVFLDYDGDGDHDVFLVSAGEGTSLRKRQMITNENGMGTSGRFYERIGGEGGHYVDVSERVGVTEGGVTLGVDVDDLNRDGRPDLYVANDFVSSDVLYLNREGEPFMKVADPAQNHQSYSSMGVEIADLNDDRLPDIFVLDMLPGEYRDQKRYLAGNEYGALRKDMARGVMPQFELNALHLHRGVDRRGIPRYSEMGRLAGLAATNWSWTPVVADLDQDAYKDVYVTNGFPKNVLDQDFLDEVTRNLTFGTRKSRVAKRREMYEERTGIRVSDYVFEQGKDLTFSDRTGEWTRREGTYSTAAVDADLDGDGDQDIVVQRVNDTPFLLKNRTNETDGGDFLTVSVRDRHGGYALGAKVTLHLGTKTKYEYLSGMSGYLSSSTAPAHFGVGETDRADSLVVVWPDGARKVVRNVHTNDHLTLSPPPSGSRDSAQIASASSHSQLFRKTTDQLGLHHRHRENAHREFTVDPVRPRMYSRTGPALAVGEVDDQHGSDVVVGGAAGQSATLFRRRTDGTFSSEPMNEADSHFEDTGMLLFDADGDGDNDLYVASGGSEFEADSLYQDRLYINDGNGNLQRAKRRLPEASSSSGCVVGADYDADGDLDLFVCGRYSPDSYPLPPESYLLQNEGGRFRDAAGDLSSDSPLGMVTSALWTDFNGDRAVDLVIVEEWGPIRFFENTDGRLVETTREMDFSNCSGLWSSIHGVDYDSDGDTDYVVGNFGQNNQFTPVSPERPLRLLTGAIDGETRRDYLLAKPVTDPSGRAYLAPYPGRKDLISKYPHLRYSIPDYKTYSTLPARRVFDSSPKQDLKAECLQSVYLEKTGPGTFERHDLPWKTQGAPIHGIVSGRIDGDPYPEIVATGNLFVSETLYGWQDAGMGAYLEFRDGRISYVENQESGLFLNGDTRSLTHLFTKKFGHVLLSGANSDSLTAVESTLDLEKRRVLKAEPLDMSASIQMEDGRVLKKEFYYGSGHYSQSQRFVLVPKSAASVKVYRYDDTSRNVSF
ncbi:MAG: VCBS repeat-containing protein [Salinivenus sp.]